MTRNLKIMGLSGMLLLSTALAACTVGPDYTAPKAEMVPFHNTIGAPAPLARPTPPLDRWWTGFDDPMLAEVVQRALNQNLTLDAAIARVTQARAAAASADAQLLPTADINATATYEHQSLRSAVGSVSSGSPGFRRDGHELAVGPSASWELDLFGGLRREATAAGEEVQAADAEQAGTRVTVAADTADAYLQVRAYQARLAVAANQIATDEHLLDLVRNRQASGAATDREIAQAEALLKQARATVPQLRFGLEQQLNRLDVLMGAQPGTYAHDLAVARAIPAIPALPGDQRPVEVLRRRPDVIAAERHLASSNERIGAAISDYYPKISLSGALGVDSVSTNHLFTSSAFQALGGGALRWRLFDFGKVDAEVALAKGANAEALAVYRQAVLRAAQDVEDLLAALATTQDHVTELQGEVAALIRARDLAQQAYQAGSITLTDVLDADRQLLTAQDELDVNRAGVARAAVGVFRALGGGWDPQGRVEDHDHSPSMAP
ncbi:efflux transporter outer membrane subunit [Nitrospirillum sp. BR 11163]|uniref:efflux transporter outer membrane subunit n=1 Tax=Nitrospirillum sp. BR 11163 TaxID=3104323 RepID=UPI002AFE5EB4|nr:efflux transporter outer membrane subunit [Nitrospirillum sp. BR 11163]MEA1672829.1 efflux transporter outer membrane subunit [Nitrospirillum sp. BR 11163]